MNDDLEEEIYIKKPRCCVKAKEELICKLNKSLYRLKHAPTLWYRKFATFTENYNFSKTMSDHCVFGKKFGNNDFIILLGYVDNMSMLTYIAIYHFDFYDNKPWINNNNHVFTIKK